MKGCRMRLRKLTIKNFKSIQSGVEDLQFIDSMITSLIGANGSGKSNILAAISYLQKNGDRPSDNELHARANGGECIIRAEFDFDQKDTKLLESKNISTNLMDRFFVEKSKSRGEQASVTYSPVGYKKDIKTEVETILGDLRNIVSDSDLPKEAESLRTKIFAIIDQIVTAKEETIFEKQIPLLLDVAKEMEQKNKETADAIREAEKMLKTTLEDKLSDSIKEVFEELSIELMDFTEYPVETQAPFTELNDGSKHAFLFDLLTLSGREAKHFKPKGPQRLRIEKSASRKVTNAIAEVWPTHKLKFELTVQGSDLLFTVLTPQGEPIELNDLSDGEKWFLCFYTRLAMAQRQGKQVLWLFDEPGRDLHSSSQIDLKRFFEKISEKSQIVYTTHQAMMVPWHRLERIFVVQNSEKKGTIINKRFWKDRKLDSPLREALSTFVGEELFTGRKHIIVEGISDYFYLQGWLRFFEKTNEDFWHRDFAPLDMVMVPVDGVGKIPLYCWFLGRDVRNKVNWVGVIDSKKEESDVRKRLENTGLGSWKENAVHIGSLAKKKNSDEVMEIENLFTESEYIEMFRTYYQDEYQNCKIPTEENMMKKLQDKKQEENKKQNKGGWKITEVIETILKDMNKGKKIEGAEIFLDKTGIAQKVYLILTQKEKIPFCQQTITNFKNVLEGIIQLLPDD